MATQTEMKIPGFGGEIFAPGAAEYDEKRVQYAFSLLSRETGTGRIHASVSDRLSANG